VPSKEIIKKAAEIIKEGGLVALPTETIYGLGADALNDQAVKKIFKAKNRPADNPLILHIADKNDLEKYAHKASLKSLKLAEKFWPGPLTIITKKSDIVPDFVTAATGNVALRMPKQETTLAIIREAGTAIAAPSANTSGKPSPTTAEHVKNDLGEKVDLIIEDGVSEIGLESTVIDMTKNPPVIARPGAISKEMIEEVIGASEYYAKEKHAVVSPGLKYRHYSPQGELILVKNSDGVLRQTIQELIAVHKLHNKKKLAVLCHSKNQQNYHLADKVFALGNNHEEIAKNLFSALRTCDHERIEIIISESFEEKGLGIAIMNRLKKAASEIIEKS
jgi:L-threonylcarbamoyladenylate synthase